MLKDSSQPSAPATPRIVFVPGQNPKPEPGIHRRLLWRCLLEGVRRADENIYHWLRAQPEIFALADWNALFYPNQIAAVDTQATIDELLRAEDGAGPGDDVLRKRRRMTLMFIMGDMFPFLAQRIPDPQIKNTMMEALRYFENHGCQADRVRAHVRGTVLQALQSRGPLLVIGHSLGSVVSFDMLWESTHLYADTWKVDLFMSLGSPLGSHFVRSRRLGAGHGKMGRYPEGIRRWVNIAADGDCIALHRKMSEDYRSMLELGLTQGISDHTSGVQNAFRDKDGWNPHRSYGYLANLVAGTEIANWLRGHTRPAE